MPRPFSPRSLKKALLTASAITLVLLAPVAIYIANFGAVISKDHARWAEMGSAMAGIYTPILAVLTLLVLVVQVLIQRALNEHTFDQSYVQDARADIHFYLEQLVRQLAVPYDNHGTMRQVLLANFAYASAADLEREDLVQLARAIEATDHRLVAMWSGVYSTLAGLQANNYPPYSNNFATAQQKSIAMLSYECCAALDNLTHVASEGRLPYSYLFSTSARAQIGAA